MKPLLSSTSRRRLAQALGFGLIVLALYAMLAAIVLAASLVMLQRGMTPDVPWIASIQQNLYMRATRSVWQTRISCVDFDGELIYKPKLGACQFANAEFKTTLNFSAEGRFTGKKPAGTGIALIGDSHAMGWGVQDEETFAAELQKLTGRPVYNLAVSSYGTVREVLRLEKSGLLDKVDTIIIQYCGNDLDENKRGEISGIDENRKKFEKITTGKQSFMGILGMVRKTYSFVFAFPFKRMKTGPTQPAPNQLAKAGVAQPVTDQLAKAGVAQPVTDQLAAGRASNDFSAHYQPFIAVLQKHPGLKDKRILVFYNNGRAQQFKGFPVGRDKLLPNVEFVDVIVDAGGFYRLDDHMNPAGHKTTAQQLFTSLGKSAAR